MNWIELDGQLKTMSDWCKVYKIRKETVQNRLGLGWPLEKAIKNPVRRHKDLSKEQFGLLKPIKFVGYKKNNPYWLCKCKCGNVVEISTSNLRAKRNKSCGCKQGEGKTKHGLGKTRTYQQWIYMKQSSISYPKEWIDFNRFIDDVGIPYRNIDFLTRKDLTKPHSKENTIWSSKEIRTIDRQNAIRLTYKGQTHNINEWAQILGVKRRTILNRIANNYSEDRIFTPKHGNKK